MAWLSKQPAVVHSLGEKWSQGPRHSHMVPEVYVLVSFIPFGKMTADIPPPKADTADAAGPPALESPRDRQVVALMAANTAEDMEEMTEEMLRLEQRGGLSAGVGFDAVPMVPSSVAEWCAPRVRRQQTLMTATSAAVSFMKLTAAEVAVFRRLGDTCAKIARDVSAAAAVKMHKALVCAVRNMI